MARIIKGNKYHRVGRLKSPTTHLMGTAFQNQHVGDVGNLPLHSAPTKTRVNRPSGAKGS